MADFAGIRMTRRIEEIRVVSFLPEFFLSAKKISRAERSTPSYLPSRRREPSWWKEGGDRPRGSNRGNKEGREEGRRERCAFHASILALKCDSRERGQNAEISVCRPPSLAEFTAPSTSEMRSFGISRRGGGKGNKDIVRRVCDANNAYTYLCNRCWYSFDVYPDESPHPFFFPITTSLSPLPSFPIFSRRVTKRSSNEKRDSKSFLFPPRSNILPHSSLLRGVFLSEGGTCKVDVSRNKIKLKIASIVAVSFVILRHFRARGETTLQRRWCGNRSPLARKRMRPKKNRYRLYRPSFVGNIVRASVCRGWEKE